MTRPLVFAFAFMLVGTCSSIGQDVKNDSKHERPTDFEGIEAGDQRELVPGIVFRWCPAGKFKMGGMVSDDTNIVDVELTRGFWLGETEVTQGQWKISLTYVTQILELESGN